MNRISPRSVLAAAMSIVMAGAGRLASAGDAPPPEYTVAVGKAFDFFHKRDFVSANRFLDEADRFVPDTPAVLNARGAIAIERKQFDDGIKYCTQALEKDPQFFLARFNLGEIPFLQKHYAEARTFYQQVLASQPSNELVQFRIFLTYLLENNEASAKAALDRVKFPGDTAAYYYAHAAWDYTHGDKRGASDWVNNGDWIFGKENNVYLADPFYDLGWLKRKGR